MRRSSVGGLDDDKKEERRWSRRIADHVSQTPEGIQAGVRLTRVCPLSSVMPPPQNWGSGGRRRSEGRDPLTEEMFTNRKCYGSFSNARVEHGAVRGPGNGL